MQKFDPPNVRTHKTCPKCRRRLPSTSFERDPSQKSGLYPYCRDCKNAQRRDRYARLKVSDPGKVLRRGAVTEAERERIAKSEQFKTCSDCKDEKLIRHFSAKPRGRYGVDARCKSCQVERVAAYRRKVRR